MNGRRGALDGLLVVAAEQAVAAPLCTARLLDAGARVIKLERPGGDFARHYDRVSAGASSYFAWLNGGKESVVVDLKDEADRAWVTRLIARADVFVENLGPGTASRYGFDPSTLRARSPRLVTCSITGFGPGPHQDRKAYDLLMQAEVGLAAITGSPEAPGRVGVSVVDIATGLAAYARILESLLARGIHGEGAHVAVSLFDAIAEWMSVPLQHFEGGGRAPARVGLRHPSIAPYGVFACREGREILLSVQNEREWRRLCAEVLERPELADDVAFHDNDARVSNRATLDAHVADALGRLSHADCVDRLDAAGIAYGNLHSVADLARHPHLRRRTVVVEGRPVSVVAPPDAPPDAPTRALPSLDAHGAALRREFA